MRFDTPQHQFSGGIDLPARSLEVGLVSHEAAILLPRTLQAAPAPCLKAVAPSREGLVVAGECLFTWYWRADRCVPAGITGVGGHALSRRAIYGGHATTAPRDSHPMAPRLRGGMLPQASVDAAARRATRPLRRRRMPRMRQRAARISHVQNPPRP
jgi:hypothetical protein